MRGEYSSPEPPAVELLVPGRHVVSKALAPEMREEAALAAVTQEAAQLAPGTGAVMGVIVRQREAQVKVITLRAKCGQNVMRCQAITSLTGTMNSLSPSWSFRNTGDLQIV